METSVWVCVFEITLKLPQSLTHFLKNIFIAYFFAKNA